MKNWHSYFLCVIFTLSCSYFALHQTWMVNLRSQVFIQLDAQQQQTLKNLSAPKIEVFVRNNPTLRRSMNNLLRPLRAYIPELQWQFINPDLDLLSAQKRNITSEGQIYLSVGDIGARIEIPSALEILRIFLQLSDANGNFIVHLQGHNERDFLSDSAHSWQAIYQRLIGASIPVVALTQKDELPQNAKLIVVADPEKISISDQKTLTNAINQGMNLLYTTDNEHRYLPEFLQDLSGLEIAKGNLVTAHDWGLNNPQFLVIENLGDTVYTRTLKKSLLLPTAVALIDTKPSNWKREPLFWSDNKTWSETGAIEGDIKHDKDEAAGMLPLAWELSRPHPLKPEETQRIVIIGDSDFLDGNYLNIGGNSAFANQLFSLLRGEKSSVIVVNDLRDQFISNSERSLQILVWTLFLLPFFVAGLFIWRFKKS